MAVDPQQRDEIPSMIPQQYPFRFLDKIVELSEDAIVGTYRFRENEYFYRGHFPDYPVTPGVILIEAMAQTGVVAFGIFLLLMQGISRNDVKKMVTLFATADNVEFASVVCPGEEVTIRGEKVYFRRGSLKTKVSMKRENGELVCTGILSGKGVIINE
jgi:3-hydroxyacyl-[acyl-carrier-protein] dehydratase